ncbi:MAG TPA: hypothetical protein V6D28_16360 [Leptolyngbyaceae cyanobacterium]
MNQKSPKKTLAYLLSALLALPFFTACGNGSNEAYPPNARYDRTARTAPDNTRPTPQARRGLNTGQKVAILAGAAALYYLYNQHKNKQQQGPQGQYYLSKNGRVYYRDAQGRARWVTPPPEGIRVPESEAQRYRDFQGYNNRPTGRDLTDLVPAQ